MRTHNNSRHSSSNRQAKACACTWTHARARTCGYNAGLSRRLHGHTRGGLPEGLQHHCWARVVGAHVVQPARAGAQVHSHSSPCVSVPVCTLQFNLRAAVHSPTAGLTTGHGASPALKAKCKHAHSITCPKQSGVRSPLIPHPHPSGTLQRPSGTARALCRGPKGQRWHSAEALRDSAGTLQRP